MRIAVLIAVAALLGGCQTPCPAVDTAPVTVSYSCADGSHLNVTYSHSPERAHIEQEGYAPLDLSSRVSGSGYRYADFGAQLQGRTSTVRWQRPGAASTVCQAATPATTGESGGGAQSTQREAAILSCRG